jgi:hypothetical protein
MPVIGGCHVTNTQSEFVWGAARIAPIIGRTEKGAFHALESGRVPGAKKMAGRWGLHLPTFHKFFTGPGASDSVAA